LVGHHKRELLNGKLGATCSLHYRSRLRDEVQTRYATLIHTDSRDADIPVSSSPSADPDPSSLTEICTSTFTFAFFGSWPAALTKALPPTGRSIAIFAATFTLEAATVSTHCVSLHHHPSISSRSERRRTQTHISDMKWSSLPTESCTFS
jgi:hypothetical protein